MLGLGLSNCIRMMLTTVLLLACYPHDTYTSLVLEHPEDVTVVMGDPATLICRVDTGDVKWFKDGLGMKIEEDEEIFQLPDGSLFFLSARVGDTALYNCGVENLDGKIIMSDPAALIVIDASDEPIYRDIETSTQFYEENQKIKTDTIEENSIHIEVIKDDIPIPAAVYIVSMIIVGVMTVMIIAGAAIIFTKIKRMPGGYNPEAGEKEWQASVMYSSPTLNCGDRGWKERYKIPACDFHRASALHQYDVPVTYSQSHQPSRIGHFSSSQLIGSNQSPKIYQKLKPIYMMPNDNIQRML